jgi:hypothetical protein
MELLIGFHRGERSRQYHFGHISRLFTYVDALTACHLWGLLNQWMAQYFTVVSATLAYWKRSLPVRYQSSDKNIFRQERMELRVFFLTVTRLTCKLGD